MKFNDFSNVYSNAMMLSNMVKMICKTNEAGTPIQIRLWKNWNFLCVPTTGS